MKLLYKISLWVLVGCLSFTANGQSSISLSTTKDSTTVGEVVVLNYQINASLDNIESIDFTPLFDIENLVYEQDTTLLDKKLDISIIDGTSLGINNQNLVIQGENVKSLKGQLKVAFYSFGVGDINTPTLKLKDGATIRPLQRSRLFVLPPASYQQMLDSLQLMDIKPIIEEGSHWTDYLVFLYGLLALFAFYLIYKFIISRKVTEEETVVEEIIIIPAHVKALEALKILDENNLWQQGDIKGYQSALTRIMREYIEDRYDVPALEMTSAQLKKELKKMSINDTLIGKLTDILQIADIVKFAKGTAGPELNQKFMNDAYEWVNTTKVIEIAE